MIIVPRAPPLILTSLRLCYPQNSSPVTELSFGGIRHMVVSTRQKYCNVSRWVQAEVMHGDEWTDGE